MKILFIGGTGRLSKDVAELALANGNEVFLFTRGTSSRKLFVNQGYHMIQGNIRDVQDSIEKLSGMHFDVVIDFLTFSESQLKSMLQIIDGKYEQYIFISSATVYEPEENEIITENRTKVGNPKWAYAYKKYVCEKYLREYYVNRKEKYTIVRPYVTYGNTRVPYPLVPRKSVFEYSFIDRVCKGMPIPTFDEGRTITTLTHTRDFAKGVVGLFLNTKAYGEAVHISNDETTTWENVLKCLENSLNIKIRREDIPVRKIETLLPEYKPVLRGDKGRNTRLNNSKIKSLVPDYDCTISLDEGIHEMVQFYNEHKELQKIDYMWNGAMDRICKVKGGLKNYPKLSLKNKMCYFMGHVFILNKGYAALKFIKQRIS